MGAVFLVGLIEPGGVLGFERLASLRRGDTVAAILVAQQGFSRRAFADEVRLAVYKIDPLLSTDDGGTVRLQTLVDDWGWDDAKAVPEVRRLLQAMGTELGRETWSQDFWIDRLFAGARIYPWVISDVRFPNEAQAIEDRGGEVWRIERPGYGPVNDHVSEVALDGWDFDKTIVNDGDLDKLEHLVKWAVER